MSQNRNPEQYEAAFQAIAEAVRELSEEEVRRISAQLGEYTHDFKHLLGLVTGANAILLRSVSSDEQGAKMMEMVEIINRSSAQLNAFIEVLVSQLYLPIRPDRD